MINLSQKYSRQKGRQQMMTDSTPFRKKALFLGTALILSASLTVSCAGSGSDASSTKSKTSSTKKSSLTFEYVDPSDLSSTSSDTSSSSGSTSSAGNSGSSGSASPGASPGGSAGGPGGSGGGADTQSYDYTGSFAASISASGNKVKSVGKTVKATAADQNAYLTTDGGTLTIKNAKITKSGSDNNGDNCNFYGLNSSVLAVGSASTIKISSSEISSTSAGSNGVFATDEATVYANDVSITTKSGGNSRGLDATYGGKIYANLMNISTEKDHCAALATDRGGGFLSVTNSTLKTAGSGSPLLYSTGDIEVDAVTGTASGSQIAGIEGKNRILIYNSKLTSTNDAISGSDPIKNGVIIYQSTSGDADTASTATGDFEAVDSTLKTTISDGAMFYVTNTNAKIVLQNTKLQFNSKKVELLNASGNSSNNWGSAGSNGGNVTLTAIDQKLKGTVTVDTISSATLYLTDNSTWTGSTIISDSSSGSTSSAPITVNIDSGSKWVVTKDCTVSNLNAADGAKIIDQDGKTVTIVANGQTVVEGDSDITVTVTGTYGTTVTVPDSAARSTKVLSRTAFDEAFDTSTKFGTNALS